MSCCAEAKDCFAALNDVREPVRVDVIHAWVTRPRTAADPQDVVFDIEEHVGASLRYHLADKTNVQVMYERAACTHGEPRSVLELEGTAGAVRWDWLMWGNDQSVSVTKDHDGQPTTTITQFERKDQVTFHDRPLVYFYRKRRGSRRQRSFMSKQSLISRVFKRSTPA